MANKQIYNPITGDFNLVKNVQVPVKSALVRVSEPSNNVEEGIYNNFADAYNSGALEILIDRDGGTPVVNSGTYDLSQIRLRSAPTGRQVVFLQLNDGATITGMPMVCDGVILYVNNLTTTIINIDMSVSPTDRTYFINSGGYYGLGTDVAVPGMIVTNGNFVFYGVDRFPNFIRPEQIEVGAGAKIIVYTWDATQDMKETGFTGAGELSVSEGMNLIDDSFNLIPPVRSGLNPQPGTYIANVTNIIRNPYVNLGGYIVGDPSYWADQGFVMESENINFQSITGATALDHFAERARKGNTFVVAKSGAEYTSIKDAIDAANLVATVTDPQVVEVHPGTYAEDPMTMNPYVQVRAMGRVVVTANDQNNPLITVSSVCYIKELLWQGPTNAPTISVGAAQQVLLEGNRFLTGLTGVHVNDVAAQILILKCDFYSGYTNGVIHNAGYVSINTVLNMSTNGVIYSGSNAVGLLTDTRFIGNTSCISVDNGAKLEGANVQCDQIGVALTVGATDPSNIQVLINLLQIKSSVVNDVIIQDEDAFVGLPNSFFDLDKCAIDGFKNFNYLLYSQKIGDESVQINGELHIGTPETPKESVFGEGDSFTDGMVVLTTDDTATSVSDGGNFLDVSATAKELNGSTFTFQGTGANHTILIGTTREKDGAKLKHWGWKVAQVVAATAASGTGKYFEVEYWDGAAWVATTKMASQSSSYYRYANSLFIRPNSSEQIRLGLMDDTTWSTKAIDGRDLYWVRIRISTALTQLPTFDQFKLHTSRYEINGDGTIERFGVARIRRTLSAGGNIFGESGGVTSPTVAFGSGAPPTGWNHQLKNSRFNGNGDAIYWQIMLPKGIDTSLPVKLRFAYTCLTSSATAADLILSSYGAGVQSVRIADPAGGIVPIQRAIGESLTGKAGETSSRSADVSNVDRSYLLEFDPIYLDDYYEDDLLAIRLEADALNGSDFVIFAVDISYAEAFGGDAP